MKRQNPPPRTTSKRSRQLPGSAVQRDVKGVSVIKDGTPLTDLDTGARPDDMAARLSGVVNKHFPDKGFGFIREHQTGREYFFHYEGTKEGTRAAFEDQYVEGTHVVFDGRNGPKGWRASAVELDA